MSKTTSKSIAPGQPEIVPGYVLAKHYRLHPNSSDIDSASVKYQYYHPSDYDEFIREDEASGKFNNFVRMGLKTDVIYNPERDENGNALYKPVTGATKVDDQREKEAADEKNRLAAEKEAQKAREKEEKELEKNRLAAEKEAKDNELVYDRDVTVNTVVFSVNKNKKGYFATEKTPLEGKEAIIGEGKNLAELNKDLEAKTL